MKKLVGLFVEGANILDLCVEGDKLIEEGTSAVYNKSVKGVKVLKGSCSPSSPTSQVMGRRLIYFVFVFVFLSLPLWCRSRISNVHLGEQLRCALFPTCVRFFFLPFIFHLLPSHRLPQIALC